MSTATHKRLNLLVVDDSIMMRAMRKELAITAGGREAIVAIEPNIESGQSSGRSQRFSNIRRAWTAS